MSGCLPHHIMALKYARKVIDLIYEISHVACTLLPLCGRGVCENKQEQGERWRWRAAPGISGDSMGWKLPSVSPSPVKLVDFIIISSNDTCFLKEIKMVSSPCTLVYDHYAFPPFFLQAVQILSGAIILVLGVFLGSLRNIFHFFSLFFFIFYTAYPLWGPIFVSIPIPLTRDHCIDTTARNVLDYYSVVLRWFEDGLLWVWFVIFTCFKNKVPFWLREIIFSEYNLSPKHEGNVFMY